MGELSPQFLHCNPAQGQRSSVDRIQEQAAEEGLVLLTSEAEGGELREVQ